MHVVVSSCGVTVFLMTNVDYIFMCLFAIHVSSLMKLFRTFAYILLGYFLITEFSEFLTYSKNKTLSDKQVANIFSQSVAYPFILLKVAFEESEY